MKIADFEKQLKEEVSAHLDIIPNPKIPGLAGLYYQGAFLFGLPSETIFEERNNQYGVELPTGVFVVHRTIPEVIGMATSLIKRMEEDKDFSDAMKGEGEYSDAALAAKKDSVADITKFKLNE